MTNFHVAFGKTKQAVIVRGKQINRLVLVNNPVVGHKVKLEFDFDLNTGEFQRTAVATVVASGIYEEGSIAGMREDLALLQLAPCAGKDFAGLELDRSQKNQKNPPGNLMIVGSLRSPEGKRFIGIRTGCRSTVETPGAGIVATSCDLVDGMSGSMLISEETLQIVGIGVSSFKFEDGTPAGISVSAKYLSKFLDDHFQFQNKPK